MLPDAVAARSSLVTGSDRLAISFLTTLDGETGEVLEWEIQPSVVNVDTDLNQKQTLGVLTSETKEEPEVVEMLQQLQALAIVLKEQRLARGSLQLNLPSIQNPFYDEGGSGCVIETDSPVSSLLTELVLLTNQLMAIHLDALGIPAIWRVQGAPDPDDVQEMLKLAINLGVELALPDDIEIQPLDYQHLTKVFAESASEQVLTYL